GELQFDANFIPHVDTDSYLDIFLIADSDGSLTLEQSVDLGRIGASVIVAEDNWEIPSNGDPIHHYDAYLGNLLTGDVYKVDLAASSPTVTPIHLTNSFTYISDLAFIPGTSLLLATSFNTDELYVIDTATNTV